MRLNRKQTLCLQYLEDDVTTEILYGGAAGGGKSIIGTYWLCRSCLRYPGTRWLMGRANLKTLKETTLQSFFQVASMQGLKADVHYRYNQQASTINFRNGSQIIFKDLFLYPSDPNFDELGSLEITGAFVDEVSQTVEKAWNVVKSRIRYKLDEYGLIPKMLGTCNPSKSFPYHRFYKLAKGGTLPADRQFIQALVSDNPDISKHYENNLMGLDDVSKQRLLYGDWEYSDDRTALIQYDKIVECFTNGFLEGGERYITVDVARFGKDKTVVGLWDGWRVQLFGYAGKSVAEVAAIVREFQETHKVPNSRTIADEDGVGGGVVDVLGCKGFVNNSSPLPSPDAPYEERNQRENYTNLKSQCYFRLADRINKGGLYIQCQDPTQREQIIQELEQVKQHNMDKDGKRQVLPKDKVKDIIGRSPDYSDTLMMREWFGLQAKPDLFMLGLNGELMIL